MTVKQKQLFVFLQQAAPSRRSIVAFTVLSSLLACQLSAQPTADVGQQLSSEADSLFWLAAARAGGPVAVPADGSGAIVPLVMYPPGFDLSGLLIYEPGSSEWINGGSYIRTEDWVNRFYASAVARNARTNLVSVDVNRLKTALDTPFQTASTIPAEVVRLLLIPKKSTNLVSTWNRINDLHHNLGTRVVTTLTYLDDIQIIEVPAEAADIRSDQYRGSGLFASVEFDAMLEKRTADDPLLYYDSTDRVPFDSNPSTYSAATYQWSMKNTGQAIQAYQKVGQDWVPYGQAEVAATNASLNVLSAWNMIDGASIFGQCRIGIIDSGIITNHPDLAGVMATDGNGNSICFSAIDSGGYLTITTNDLTAMGDIDGHGTEMAGLISANANNGIGISGVCPGAKLLVAKTQFGLSEVIAAMNWEVANNADVINCSWGNRSGSAALLQAVASAQSRGIIAVCAVANSPDDYDSPAYEDYPQKYKKTLLNPSGLDNIINVTDIMEAGQILTGGAAYGKNTVDFGAPGRRLPTTGHDLSFPYVYASGTSVAAAETSACIAILKHAFPNENYHALIGRLYSGIEPAIEGDLLNSTICAG